MASLQPIIVSKDRFSDEFLGKYGIFMVGVGKNKIGDHCISVSGTGERPKQLPSQFEGFEVEYETVEMPVLY